MTRRTGIWTAIAVGVVILAYLAWWNSPTAPPDKQHADPGDVYRDEAAAHLKANRLEEALTLIERWKRSIPDDGRAVLASAELAARREQPARAVELYSSVAASSIDPARVWLRVADLQVAMGQSEMAVESCRKAVAARPNANDARLRLGDLLRIVGRLDEAAEVLNALVERAPTSLPACHALAAVRNGQGRFEDVVKLIGPFLEDASLAANARQHYAIALDELGRRAEAAAIWTDLLEADPFLVEGYYRLGRLARRLKKSRLSRIMLDRYEELTAYKDKLESARKATLSGRRAAASIERAKAYTATHQVRLAVECLERAVRRSPGTDIDATLAVILSLLRFDLLHEAEEIIRALRSTPALPAHVADAMTGRVADRAGDATAARVAYERALAARPDYRSVLLALARSYIKDDPAVGEISVASALATRAHQASPDAESTLLMGRAAFANGDLDVANDRFERALRLAKRGRWRTEARLYLGNIRLARQDADGAGRILEELVAEAPTMTGAWNALAEVRRVLGDVDRAAEATRKAAELKELEEELLEIRRSLYRDPAARSPHFVRLAELAGRSGNRARQLQYLRTALHVDARNAAAYRQLAATYAEPGEVFLRIHALLQLAALEPGDAEARRLLAEARAAVGIQK